MQAEQLDTIQSANTDANAPNWVVNAAVLWEHRRLLMRVAAVALVVSVAVAFLIPKRYQSTARIMPPESTGTGAALFAALAGRGGLGDLGSLSGLAGSLLGARTSSALFAAREGEYVFRRESGVPDRGAGMRAVTSTTRRPLIQTMSSPNLMPFIQKVG